MADQPKHIFNVVPSDHDDRDLLYTPPLSLMGDAKMPLSVDLSKQCSPVVDQGQLGSCTACAMASGAREFLLLKAKDKPYVPLSRLFLYYEEREAEGTTQEDSGAQIKTGLECLLHMGACEEALDPYTIENFTKHASEEAVANAANYKINVYSKLKNVSNIKTCLASGYPVVLGMEVYPQMESREAATEGIVRVPASTDSPLGGHAVLIVGYHDTPRWQPGYWKGGGWFLVRNSWGDRKSVV